MVFTALRSWAPSTWWPISAAVFALLIVLTNLAPALLLPLFYRFKPLDRPALVQRLMTLAARARTDVSACSSGR